MKKLRIIICVLLSAIAMLALSACGAPGKLSSAKTKMTDAGYTIDYEGDYFFGMTGTMYKGFKTAMSCYKGDKEYLVACWFENSKEAEAMESLFYLIVDVLEEENDVNFVYGARGSVFYCGTKAAVKVFLA